MSPIIPIILAAVLGFGMGYKLKDCLCKGKKSSDLPDIKNLLPKSPKASKMIQRKKVRLCSLCIALINCLVGIIYH